MNCSFTGKYVVVVGASGGIAQATVQGFADGGARVMALDLSPEAAAKPFEGYSGAGSVTFARIDVTDENSVNEAIDSAAFAGGGKIDVLAYVAGGLMGLNPTPFEATSLDEWNLVVDVNLNGSFLVCRRAIPALRKAGRASVVLVTSGAGLGPSRTGVPAYAAAKHGQVGLVKQLAIELMRDSINVNSVAPGFMPTGDDAKRYWQRWTEEAKERYLSQLVGGRAGRADDISNALLFLASEQASWITGQTLAVTGAPL